MKKQLQIYIINAIAVYYSIYRMIGNQEEAKDILQYGFMKSFEHIDEIVDDDHFVKYLYTVVNNKCIDYLKKKKSINFSEIVEESEDNFEIEDLNEDFIRDKVANVQALRDYISEELNKLPNDQKMCIMLYFYEQLSISEISSMLQCSESTIKSKLKYGKQKLADSIGRYQKENDIKLYNISVVPLMMWMFNANVN